MKKVFKLIITIILICSNMNVCFSESGLDVLLTDIWLNTTKNTDIAENIQKSLDKEIKERIQQYSVAPDYALRKIGVSTDYEIMKEQVKELFEMNSENIIKIYYLDDNIFTEQYVRNGNLQYLISDSCYFAMKCKNDLYPSVYNNNGFSATYSERYDLYSSYILFNNDFDTLKNKEYIKNVLAELDETEIVDIKILVLNKECTCMYIKTTDDEYLMRIYIGWRTIRGNERYKWADSFELYKLYRAEDALKIISDTMDEMNEEKETFEAEALALQSDGLLNGNEKGLDLLKPLTRIEAAAMLLRAMGESETADTQSVGFVDVPSTHWGYGAAMKAQELGIVNGVGNNSFAPDDRVTVTQFATMVLRAANEPDFDWQTALDMIIQKGIITEENAKTMDLFTRGDMAKIIYEARAKGIL